MTKGVSLEKVPRQLAFYHQLPHQLKQKGIRLYCFRAKVSFRIRFLTYKCKLRMSLVGRILRPTRIPPLPTIVTQVVLGPWPACPWRRCRWSWWPPVLRRRPKFPGKITGPSITWWYEKLVLDGAIITKMKDSTNNLLGKRIGKKATGLYCNHGPQPTFPGFSNVQRIFGSSQASLASTLRSTPSAFRIHGPCFLAAMVLLS